VEEGMLLGIGKAGDGGFFETVLDAGCDLHRIFGVAEENCVLGNAGSIESIVSAL